VIESAIIQPRKIKPCSNAIIVDSAVNSVKPDCDIGFDFRPEFGLFVSVHLCIKRCAECSSGNSDFALACLVMPFAALPVIGYI